MPSDFIGLQTLFLTDIPMMDVRAPVEFNKGAFPNTVNLPLMDDEERRRVGICYKEHGPDKALALGHRLVSGEIKAQRLAGWAEFARANPDGCLYCFRGGQRSSIVQQWLREECDIRYPRVAGGYKAMRTFLIDALASAANECRYTILGGLTGSGKTEVISLLANGLDLEGFANHRGSSFGKRLSPQPAQIDFENTLAIQLLRHRAQGMAHFVLEDESRHIGSLSLPLGLHQQTRRSPMVWLEEPLEARVTRIVDEYVVQLYTELCHMLNEADAHQALSARLHQSLSGIARRLGLERYQRLSALLQHALEHDEQHGDPNRHRAWVAALLTEYYDPMYASQRQRHEERIVFRGARAEVLAYLAGKAAAAETV